MTAKVYQIPTRDVQEKTTRTRAEAINAKCRSCLYDPVLIESWRSQIDRCETSWCPLFCYRPRLIGKPIVAKVA